MESVTTAVSFDGHLLFYRTRREVDDAVSAVQDRFWSFELGKGCTPVSKCVNTALHQ